MPEVRWKTIAASCRAARGGIQDYRDLRRRSAVSRNQTEVLLRSLQLALEGVTVLELGPGAGSSLDIFAVHGAVARFVERNPLLALECARRGHRGWCFDFVRSRDRIPRDFGLVYARGSIAAHRFADGRDFSDWLARLGNSDLVLCPWIQGPPPDWFSGELEEAGCHRTEWIEGYNVPDIYPDLWLRGAGGVRLPPSQRFS